MNTTLLGAGIGAGLGGLHGAMIKKRWDRDAGKMRDSTKKERFGNAVAGTVLGGTSGALIGSSFRSLKRRIPDFDAQDFSHGWNPNDFDWDAAFRRHGFRPGARGAGGERNYGRAAGSTGPKTHWQDPAANHRAREQARAAASFEKTPVPFSGIKSQREAKQKYRDLAFAAHPDRGGSETKMKEINQQWQKYKNHPSFPKVAMAYALFDELSQLGW